MAKISIYVPDRTLWVTFTTENGLILHVVLKYLRYTMHYTPKIFTEMQLYLNDKRNISYIDLKSGNN